MNKNSQTPHSLLLDYRISMLPLAPGLLEALARPWEAEQPLEQRA